MFSPQNLINGSKSSITLPALCKRTFETKEYKFDAKDFEQLDNPF